MRHIQHLFLLIDFKWIVAPDEHWPSAQKFLGKNLPALQDFELRTRFPTGRLALVETHGEIRDRQELRALAQFQAFFVARKLELDMLVLTKRRIFDSRVHISVKAMNSGCKLDAGDVLLDGPVIRRLRWDELHDHDVRLIEMVETPRTAAPIERAEFDVLPADAANIEKLGYKTWAELQSMGEFKSTGIKEWPTVDFLIWHTRENAWECEVSREGES
jgi:hypothetical protein